MNIKYTLFFLALIISTMSCNKSSHKQTITIPDGKVGMIGFGSLMSLQRTEEVFNHKYTDSIYVVHLEGYQRSWDYVTANNDKDVYTEEDLEYNRFYIKDKDTLGFENTIYLNITEQVGISMNCVLYMVTEEEINDMDRYEFGYERIDVSDRIKEYSFEGGKVYAYKAIDKYLYDPDKTIGTTIIPQDYVNLVTNACDSIGSNFRQEYDMSTDSRNIGLMAPVLWIKEE